LPRFASTVAFYERGRPPYGVAFFADVARALGFDRSQRLLDLGTGPGLLALGFAPFCGEVVAVDPEPAMIEAAQAAAEEAGVALQLLQGTAETLPASLGSFDTVTIGRALHWMDREPTCAVLDRVVAPHGQIIICRAASVADGRNAWLATYETVRSRWTQAGRTGRHGLDADAFFAGTRFRRAAPLRTEMRRAILIERLADRVLSMSSSSPERIGDDARAMRAALHEALAPFANRGLIDEIVEARADVFSSNGSR